MIEEDACSMENYLLVFQRIIRNTYQALNKKKTQKTGKALWMLSQYIGREGGRESHFSVQKHLYFSLALFYLHNLGLLIPFLFCMDNCFVVSALTLSDSAFGRLTAKSIGRRLSSYTERCFLSAE